ncbi:hypothetical protein HNV11_13005 [Spirosoma taeanense]|uniref:Uncharacterized protein n=1 Tax=Spirosoma taeanense TaxID=2735870 RepID=A0A6M5Y8I7_9BACT|nr:hypothetical protein [Spirosoma taeanense]QJW90229.1 hypothetical protein HNV11_13005 [Spirosoma taeanense]
MFDLNPLNLPDAPMQHLIMLGVTGVLGFIIGYISQRSLVRQLEDDLAITERDIEECQRWPISGFGINTDEIIVLNRIRARAGEFDLSRIGRADATEADDLKQIVGVGPFLEKKLHAIGVYTFRQIAHFNQEDIDKVTDLIEYFPGRIQRDNWVGQSAELAKRRVE